MSSLPLLGLTDGVMQDALTGGDSRQRRHPPSKVLLGCLCVSKLLLSMGNICVAEVVNRRQLVPQRTRPVEAECSRKGLENAGLMPVPWTPGLGVLLDLEASDGAQTFQ